MGNHLVAQHLIPTSGDTSTFTPWLCLHGAAPCVCYCWLFSESLHVPSSTRQVKQGKALVFTDDETEA